MAAQRVFSRQFWRDFWIDLRRVKRDGRARKSLLARLLALIYLLGVTWYYGATAYSFHDPVTAIILVSVAAIMLLIFVAVRWSQHRESQRQLVADIASADPVLVQRLQKLAYGLAALNERASSELFARYKTLPEGLTVNTRRIHIDLLKVKGIWDDLPVRVRLWLMRPDGGWPPEVALQVRQTEEKLHTLLWAIALSSRLRPLESMEKPLDFAALEKLLAKPAPGIRPTWDLRTERDKAQPYFFRLYAESIHRGHRESRSEEQASGVEAWVGAIASGDEPDMLSGASTVAELDDSALQQVARSAACRYQVLSMLLDSLTTNGRWKPFATRMFSALPRQSSTAE